MEVPVVDEDEGRLEEEGGQGDGLVVAGGGGESAVEAGEEREGGGVDNEIRDEGRCAHVELQVGGVEASGGVEGEPSGVNEVAAAGVSWGTFGDGEWRVGYILPRSQLW